MVEGGRERVEGGRERVEGGRWKGEGERRACSSMARPAAAIIWPETGPMASGARLNAARRAPLAKRISGQEKGGAPE
jgi:hypothetical protein